MTPIKRLQMRVHHGRKPTARLYGQANCFGLKQHRRNHARTQSRRKKQNKLAASGGRTARVVCNAN